MIQVPVCFGSTDNPVVFGSTGHMIIQCGGSLIGVPEVALGSLALNLFPPTDVFNSWFGVRGLAFVRSEISFPLHSCLIGTVRLPIDDSGMSWIAGESIGTFPQHHLVALVIQIDDLSCLCDVWGCSGQRTSHCRICSVHSAVNG
jgi:hypothetical protein